MNRLIVAALQCHMVCVCVCVTIYRVGVTLSLETVKHHCLAAASSRGPGRTDEDPDKGVCRGGPQALCQAEEAGGLATTNVRPPLVSQQC